MFEPYHKLKGTERGRHGAYTACNVLDKWLRRSWSFRIIIHSNSRKVLRRKYSTTAVSVLRFCSDPQQASSYVVILPGV